MPRVHRGVRLRHAGLIPRVNHSCDPNCGIRLNSAGAHDLIARAPIATGTEPGAQTTG